MKLAVLGTGKGKFGFFAQIRLLGVMLLALLLLSGCVRYDVGVNFESPHHGEIVQSIQLGERLTAFSEATAQEWLNSIARRAKQLQGSAKRVSDRELQVTIPFNTGEELEEKFNQFFNPPAKNKQQSPVVATVSTEFPEIQSSFRLHQSNLLLLLRNHLSYDLDLRSLSQLSPNGTVLVDPSSLLNSEFRLNTPWGARAVTRADYAITPESYNKGHQLVWKLQPGELNHVEAVFWMPSPLGIGAAIIALLVAAGSFLKYQVLPSRKSTAAQPVRQS